MSGSVLSFPLTTPNPHPLQKQNQHKHRTGAAFAVVIYAASAPTGSRENPSATQAGTIPSPRVSVTHTNVTVQGDEGTATLWSKAKTQPQLWAAAKWWLTPSFPLSQPPCAHFLNFFRQQVTYLERTWSFSPLTSSRSRSLEAGKSYSATTNN